MLKSADDCKNAEDENICYKSNQQEPAEEKSFLRILPISLVVCEALHFVGV